jgi:hypothetical protein
MFNWELRGYKEINFTEVILFFEYLPPHLVLQNVTLLPYHTKGSNINCAQNYKQESNKVWDTEFFNQITDLGIIRGGIYEQT